MNDSELAKRMTELVEKMQVSLSYAAGDSGRRKKLHEHLSPLFSELAAAKAEAERLREEVSILKMPDYLWHTNDHGPMCRTNTNGYFTAGNGRCPSCGVYGDKVHRKTLLDDNATLRQQVEELRKDAERYRLGKATYAHKLTVRPDGKSLWRYCEPDPLIGRTFDEAWDQAIIQVRAYMNLDD